MKDMRNLGAVLLLFEEKGEERESNTFNYEIQQTNMHQNTHKIITIENEIIMNYLSRKISYYYKYAKWIIEMHF